jgi:hypothetical protein
MVTGGAVTVTAEVADTLGWFARLAVIVAAPGVTAVAKPVWSTVATAAADAAHDTEAVEPETVAAGAT